MKRAATFGLFVAIAFPTFLDAVERGKVDRERWAPALAPNEKVMIKGDIDKKSHVILKGGEGVTIAGKIDGKSHLEIVVSGKVVIKGNIDGESDVNVTCDEFICEGKMDNPKTHVKITCKRSTGPMHDNGTLILNGDTVGTPK
jgi:uncharacterized protein YdeI (BOF family)